MTFEERVSNYLNSLDADTKKVLNVGEFNTLGFSVKVKNADLFSVDFGKIEVIHISWNSFIKSLDKYEEIEYI